VKKKKIFIIIAIIFVLAIICYFIYTKVEITNENKITEYTPEEEITRRATKANSNILIF
jgi:flagellar basal body-associated protein FliL